MKYANYIIQLTFYSKILKRSIKLGLGSVRRPIQMTAGVNPQKRNGLVFWKIKSISNSFKARLGSLRMLTMPFDPRLRGTGIFCIERKRSGGRFERPRGIRKSFKSFLAACGKEGRCTTLSYSSLYKQLELFTYAMIVAL